MIKYVIGDATQPEETNEQRVIVHCCNDIGGWGSGFVLALSKRWARPEEWYRRWYRKGFSPLEVTLSGSPLPVCDEPFKLGSVQFIEVEPKLWVANMIGQHGVSFMGGSPIRYQAFEDGFERIARFCRTQKASVHAPRLGSGLAGGSWSRIEIIIKNQLVFHEIPVTIYDLQ